MDIDAILEDVGGYGKYQQLVIWLILLPASLPCGFNAYNQLFMATVPDHWCQVPELDGTDKELVRNISIPLELKDGVPTFSKCHMYTKNNSRTTQPLTDETIEDITQKIIPCESGWHFDDSGGVKSIVTDWNLVCAKSFHPTLALILFGVGGLIGNYIFGYMLDGIGRKLSFYIYLGIQCVFGITTAFATDFTTWTILRFLTGLTIPALLGTPLVLSIELVGPSYRTFVTLIINLGYAVGLMILAYIAWAVREWRYFTILTTAPFLLIFLQWPLMPESPRFLLAKGNFIELEKLLTKMARVNGKLLPANYMTTLKRKVDESQKKKEEENTNYGVSSLFLYPNLRWKTIIITLIWFTNTSVYVGLSYYATAMGGDEYLNFFLTGAVELPAYLFLWPALEKWGRRWNLCITMVVGGLACILTVFFKNDETATLLLYCIGKMGISCAFLVVPLVASELYPTVIRGIGLSVSSVVGMIGPIVIPLINHLGNNMLTLPLVIMGTMCAFGGLCSLLLPETLNEHLPQTLADSEKAGLHCVRCGPIIEQPITNETKDQEISTTTVNNN